MALNIVTSTQPLTINHLIVFLYGDPGVWKTSLAFTAKQPILFDFDKGAYRASNRKDTVQIQNWLEVVNFTADDLAGYDTIIIDTAGRVLDLITDFLKQDAKNIRRGSGELSMQGYGKLATTFTNWLKMLRNMDKDIVILAHAGEDKDGDNIIKRPDMVGGSKKEVYKIADMMGYMTVQQGMNGAERVLSFSPSPNYLAKDSGQIGNVILKPMSQSPNQLGDMIEATKNHINRLTAEQAQAQKELDDFRTELLEAKTADELNELKDRLNQNHPFTHEMKRAIMDSANKLGAKFNRATNHFEQGAASA